MFYQMFLMFYQVNVILFIDFHMLQACDFLKFFFFIFFVDFLKFDWCKMLNDYVSFFSLTILPLRMTAVSVKTLKNLRMSQIHDNNSV